MHGSPLGFVFLGEEHGDGAGCKKHGDEGDDDKCAVHGGLSSDQCGSRALLTTLESTLAAGCAIPRWLGWTNVRGRRGYDFCVSYR